MRATDRLWRPITLGRIPLDNRLEMAPVTRDRFTPERIFVESNAEYYAKCSFYGASEHGYTDYAMLPEEITAGSHAA